MATAFEAAPVDRRARKDWDSSSSPLVSEPRDLGFVTLAKPPSVIDLRAKSAVIDPLAIDVG